MDEEREIARVLTALEASLSPDLVEEVIWKMSPCFKALLEKYKPPKLSASSLRKTIAKRVEDIETSLSNIRTFDEKLAAMPSEFQNDAIYKSAAGRLAHAKRQLQRACGTESTQLGKDTLVALHRDLNTLYEKCPSMSFGAASCASGKVYEKRVKQFVERLPMLKANGIIAIYNANLALKEATKYGFRHVLKECDILFTRNGRLLGIAEIKVVPEDGQKSLDKLFPYIDCAEDAFIVDHKDVRVTSQGLRNHLLIIPQDTSLPLPSHQFKSLQNSTEYSLAVVRAHEKRGNLSCAHAAMSKLNQKVRKAVIQRNRDVALHIEERTRRGLPPNILRIVLRQSNVSHHHHTNDADANAMTPDDAHAAHGLSEALWGMIAEDDTSFHGARKTTVGEI